jgi:hypothetical protein
MKSNKIKSTCILHTFAAQIHVHPPGAAPGHVRPRMFVACSELHAQSYKCREREREEGEKENHRDRQKDKQTKRQPGRKTDRQTDNSTEQTRAAQCSQEQPRAAQGSPQQPHAFSA